MLVITDLYIAGYSYSGLRSLFMVVVGRWRGAQQEDSHGKRTNRKTSLTIIRLGMGL